MDEYENALKNASRTELIETMIASSTACRNVHRPSCDLQDLPDRPPENVSLYFIGFIITKVCSPFCFILLLLFFSSTDFFQTGARQNQQPFYMWCPTHARES